MSQLNQVKPGARPERHDAALALAERSPGTCPGGGSRTALSRTARTPLAAGSAETAPLLAAWHAAERAWLAAQASPHTRRHYRTSWAAFCEFIGDDGDPLRITSDDVNAWIASLRAHDRAASTIVSRVAACASLYDFVAGHVPELLTNRYGRLRDNPFRNEAVRRPRITSNSNPQPLPDPAVQSMLASINTDCVSGARDRALLLTALTTGWQTADLVSLRWAGREEDAGNGEVVELWQRGAAQVPAPLPPAACNAVRHYLTLAGRWPLAPGKPVWLPLRSDGVANFPGARPDPSRSISGCQANNILRRRLRLAGVAQPEQYHLRDLRRTFARKYLTVGGDANGLGRRLEHARASVTQRYIAHLAAPVTEDAVLAGWV